MARFVTYHEPIRVGRFLGNGKGPTEERPPYRAHVCCSKLAAGHGRERAGVLAIP